MQRFDHEKLDVYHRSIEFVAWAGELCELIPRGPSVRKQLDRASKSIPLNIAEGNGSTQQPIAVATSTLHVAQHWNPLRLSTFLLLNNGGDRHRSKRESPYFTTSCPCWSG